MSTIDPVRSALAVAVLLAIAVVTVTVARVHVRAEILVSVARAAVQLVVVALVIAFVFRHPQWVAVYLGIMIVAATLTSARRIGCGPRATVLVGGAIVSGALCAVIPVLASGALAWQSETIVPFAAQIIGGSMTAASLTGSRLRDDAARDWGQVEAWLALGATARQATTDFGRLAVARALISPIDQTRSAGLVTLPGAFVGLLLGGASPAEAAEVQLLVLAGLLAAQAVSAVLTARLLSTWVGTAQPATT